MKTTTLTIFVGLGLLVVGLWLSVILKIIDWISIEDLQPLYTGLGFLAVVAAFLNERQAAAKAAADHAQLVEAMLEQARKIGGLINATARSSRVACLAAELAVRESQLVHQDAHDGADDAAARRQTLLTELSRLA